jgi:hypothetical protein
MLAYRPTVTNPRPLVTDSWATMDRQPLVGRPRPINDQRSSASPTQVLSCKIFLFLPAHIFCTCGQLLLVGSSLQRMRALT